jgi:hypothetical protein
MPVAQRHPFPDARLPQASRKPVLRVLAPEAACR